ncbi:endogenous retroviral envelope protein HEMO-like [Hemicordylus capensis]|uniref:endogenous retroviral envelope protein HEMO-like n=1 Tax=Hemicordylus capensis TaxID=884348 RepID=UPI002304C3E7|nr:endogenous retroviral envelope protein HEMO-like [Hemicordylus capensis]XP_053125105.1 endogenous retroviral envelope protein HEMO-like [Hemicordylus capensis]XP_053125106.1 endogenous retroviral envelope protein HEMO-like [Hemicordylus capensis]XP_053125107.1 endogenous retroviral envelope protein HEMO-like [Hemicordylus capensis]XP_053125108.1 endogenous retroviral envelope protein HEMO-like [Hemicordylus capensis]XP_053125109.1 endogenous retroviral envelope protein HEMO-like [Hemicordyl
MKVLSIIGIIFIFRTYLVEGVKHPHVKILQAIVNVTTLKNCWICTHADIYSEEKIALVSGPVPLEWWIRKPKMGWAPVWVSDTDLAWRPTRVEKGKRIWTFSRHWERNWLSKGIPEFFVETMMPHPICIENENGTGKYLGAIPYPLCAHTLEFSTEDGEWWPMDNQYRTECDGTNLNVENYFSIQGKNAPVVYLNFTQGGWLNESQSIWNYTLYYHERLSILINKTSTDYKTCKNTSYRWNQPLYYVWRSIAGAFQRDSEQTNGWFTQSKEYDLALQCSQLLNPQDRQAGSTSNKRGSGNFLTLIINDPGVYWVCGRAVYKALPPGWSGRCAPSYITPQINVYTHLNASKVVNLGSFIHRIKREERGTIYNPIVERNTGFQRAWRVIIPALGVAELERAIINISREMETGFNATLTTLLDLQEEVSSLSSMVIQNRKALDILAAQQGGACALIGEKCCYYVNKEKQIVEKAQDLKDTLTVVHSISQQDPSEIWDWLTNWMPDWERWVKKLMLFLLPIICILIVICCCIQWIPHCVTRAMTCVKRETMPRVRYHRTRRG